MLEYDFAGSLSNLLKIWLQRAYWIRRFTYFYACHYSLMKFALLFCRKIKDEAKCKLIVAAYIDAEGTRLMVRQIRGDEVVSRLTSTLLQGIHSLFQFQPRE